MEPVGQVGKEGIGDNMLKSFSDCLEKRELIKVTILGNSPDEAEETGRELARRLNAECVMVIGRRVILYRRSKRKDVDHIEI